MQVIREFGEHIRKNGYNFFVLEPARLVAREIGSFYHNNEIERISVFQQRSITTIGFIAFSILASFGFSLALPGNLFFIPLRAILNIDSDGGALESVKNDIVALVKEFQLSIEYMSILFPIKRAPSGESRRRCELLGCDTHHYSTVKPSRFRKNG